MRLVNVLARRMDSVRQMLKNKIIPLQEAISHVDSLISNESVELVTVSSAPLWLKLLYGNNYFAYGHRVYVPLDHLRLVGSDRNELRTVATSNLLPVLLMLKDYGYISIWLALSYRLGWRLRTHYFIYKYLFLRASDSPYLDSIYGGFLITTKVLLCKRIVPEAVSDYLNQTLAASIQSLKKNPTS